MEICIIVKDIKNGVERRLIESTAEILRLKKENNELKEIIKTKNTFIKYAGI